MKEKLETRWDLTHYLISLGMSEPEAKAWIKARGEGELFGTARSDGVGHHLDKVWRRSLRSLIQVDPESRATGQVQPIRELKHGYLLDRLATRRMISAILCGYCLAIWLYVIAFQIANPASPYWPVAWWLPIRMDYFGEAGFLASFVFAIIWAKLR